MHTVANIPPPNQSKDVEWSLHHTNILHQNYLIEFQSPPVPIVLLLHTHKSAPPGTPRYSAQPPCFANHVSVQPPRSQIRVGVSTSIFFILPYFNSINSFFSFPCQKQPQKVHAKIPAQVPDSPSNTRQIPTNSPHGCVPQATKSKSPDFAIALP